MRQGTTPTHIFTLPFDVSMISVLSVIYAQEKKVLFRKETKDCALVGSQVSVTLSQEETLRFRENVDAEVQLHVIDPDGVSFVSDIFRFSVHELIGKEVLS